MARRGGRFSDRARAHGRSSRPRESLQRYRPASRLKVPKSDRSLMFSRHAAPTWRARPRVWRQRRETLRRGRSARGVRRTRWRPGACRLASCATASCGWPPPVSGTVCRAPRKSQLPPAREVAGAGTVQPKDFVHAISAPEGRTVSLSAYKRTAPPDRGRPCLQAARAERARAGDRRRPRRSSAGPGLDPLLNRCVCPRTCSKPTLPLGSASGDPGMSVVTTSAVAISRFSRARRGLC